MKKLLAVLTAVLLLLTLGACRSEPDEEQDMHTKDIFAMDTYMTVKTYGKNGEEALTRSEQEIHRLDKLLSTGSASSEVGAINEKGSGTLSEDGRVLLKKSLELYDMTDGAFDVSIYPVMKLWGFTDQKYKVPKDSQLQEALALVNAGDIVFDAKTGDVSFAKDGMAMDFGGIAKGYTSQRLTEIIKDAGVESALINLGGNVQTVGTRPDGSDWRIGIQAPDNEEDVIGGIETHDMAVITSGGYERFFEEDGVRYHHIIDPSTGYPADNGLTSVTIVCDDGMTADGLSTALFVMGKEKAMEFWKAHKDLFQCVLVDDDGALYVSEGLKEGFTAMGGRTATYF